MQQPDKDFLLYAARKQIEKICSVQGANVSRIKFRVAFQSRDHQLSRCTLPPPSLAENCKKSVQISFKIVETVGPISRSRVCDVIYISFILVSYFDFGETKIRNIIEQTNSFLTCHWVIWRRQTHGYSNVRGIFRFWETN